MSKKEVKQEQETLIDDPTTGTEPIMPEPKSITIESVEYKFHRLTMNESLAMLRILSRVGPELLDNLINEFVSGQFVWGNFVMAITLAIGYAKEDIYQIIGRFLGVNTRAFDDPEKFPADSLPDILYALKDSPDVKAFFTKHAGKMKG